MNIPQIPQLPKQFRPPKDGEIIDRQGVCIGSTCFGARSFAKEVPAQIKRRLHRRD